MAWANEIGEPRCLGSNATWCTCGPRNITALTRLNLTLILFYTIFKIKTGVHLRKYPRIPPPSLPETHFIRLLTCLYFEKLIALDCLKAECGWILSGSCFLLPSTVPGTQWGLPWFLNWIPEPLREGRNYPETGGTKDCSAKKVGQNCAEQTIKAPTPCPIVLGKEDLW